MKDYKLIMSKIGKEVVYLYNPEQEIAVRIEPEQEFWFAKERGERNTGCIIRLILREKRSCRLFK